MGSLMLRLSPLLVLVSCHPAADPAVAQDALRLYERASIDLRGVRPSYGEAQIVLGDPSAVDDRIADLLTDPRFGWQAALLYAPFWGTRADESDVVRLDLAMPDETTYLASVGEEPLRIVAWIADHDLPWTDIVRGEWTMADEVLATRFPVDYPEGGTGWQQVHYTDGRAMAGVLSSSGMWWRYSSTFNNANRGRVNALSRILLCKDYLDQQVDFPTDLDLTDEDAVREAVRTNPACLTCHGDIDPIGAYLWGYYSDFSNDPTDWAYYHADREHLWETFGTAPGYFGEAGSTVDDLGRQLAGDPRIIDCLVQRTWGNLLQRAPTSEDAPALALHREDLLAGGVTVRSLYASILKDPAYRAVSGASPAWKLMSPDQYASAVEDLTGFRFSVDGHDVFEEDALGMRSLAGSTRVSDISEPVPTPTMAQVQKRIAEAAASYVTTSDAADPAHARLFTSVTFGETPSTDPDAMAAQVQSLHLRILGEVVAADGYEVQTALALWSDVYALHQDPQEAWAAVVTALLRDPSFVVY